MAFEVFTQQMTALADAIRAKFGVTGNLTVADMVTAVSGQAYSSAGTTLAGFNADMIALGNAIRIKVGASGVMTIQQMTIAVESISSEYTSFMDESLCENIDVSDYDRISIVLPAGTYTDFKIYGISKEPLEIKYGTNVTGYTGTAINFTYSESSEVIQCGDIGGGRLVIFNDGGLIRVSSTSNFGSGFEFPTQVKAAASGVTGINKVIKDGGCLMIKFSSYTA